MSTPIDPTRCPLCGEDNACGAEKGSGNCWCFSARVSEGVLDRVPESRKNLACVCERCASGKRSAAEAQAIIDALTKPR